MIRCEIKKWNVQHPMLSVLLSISIALVFTSHAQAKDKAYPGELINVGTHRLHIYCIGEGSPSVIIDSGIGGFSLEWFRVQNNLSNDVKICSYDRAGYGWSDPGPRPRTTIRIARELKTLLIEAKIPAPYLLVGHSFGGYNVRYFASEYPEQTAGLVLIDSSHPQQFNTEEFKRIKAKLPLRKYKHSVRVRLITPIIAKNYPPENKRVAYRLMSSMKSKRTLMNEMDFMEISARQIALRENQKPVEMPVVIITRAKRVWPENELGDRREQQWSRLQNDLERISLNSSHVLAYKSGHLIHIDQPDLVSKNILYAINKSRTQILEKELIKKFDVRQARYSTTLLFAETEPTFRYNENKLDASTHNKPIHPLILNSESSHIVNHSTYFLR